MKKYFLLSIAGLCAIIFIFSCKKSFDTEPNKNHAITSMSATEQGIVEFLSSLNNPLKDEQLYTVGEVLYLSTAGLNYTYAIYDSVYVYTSIDTSYFSMDIDVNERVSSTDLLSAYGDMVDTLASHYDELQDNIKHLIYCVVFEQSIQSGKLYVGLIYVFGTGYTTSFYGEFGQTDYWYSILDYGKCDEYEPEFYEERDAGDEIAYKINFPNTDNIPNYRVYAIPISDYFVEASPWEYYYEPSPSGYRAYFFEGAGSFLEPQCLSPTHLNFYLSSNGIYYIIQVNEPQGGYEFIWIEIEGDLMLTTPYKEAHLMYLWYGEINTTETSPEEF